MTAPKQEGSTTMTANLERFAASIIDRNVIDLMVRMSKLGQAADRKGDTEGVAKYQEAYDVYRAEAERRGLVEQR